MGWQSIRYDYAGADILVTGGTSGIGRAIATAFREAGANVTVTGTRASANEYDADLSGMRYLPLDLEDDGSIDAVADAVPACDVLVNNAGMSFYPLGLDERDPDVFARAVRIHLTAPYRLTRKLAGKLAASGRAGGGCVVGIGSVTSFMGLAVTLGYGAGKTGLLGMTRGLAVDLGASGIRLNVVAAGLVETAMTAAVFSPEGSAWREPSVARTPLGRLGKPDDIAGPVLFLASDAAAWITGQTIMVDGGYTISG
ncbi:SDR family oxidoreductase [Altererythrobacter aerius]|uniref:SDR family oxidoreductase n=1 Tax=Tsuneonella aeria TaxID=1837929 RepID=A0A6I4T9V6_9SPHN|nr:SDR family oxidoreductase [Tsuneonella aeria]